MATQILIDETPVKIETSGDDTYLGFPLHGKGTATDEPVWGIKKVDVLGGSTDIVYPDGSKMKKFVWDDRETYTYYPYASKPGSSAS
jgi:hypothetical protein